MKWPYDWWYKVRVLEAYSKGIPHCEYCGLTNMEALTLDHIDGGGNIQRRKVGGGVGVYRWLYKHDFPPGYQVLCQNCNATKTHHGIPEHYVFLNSKRIKNTQDEGVF